MKDINLSLIMLDLTIIWLLVMYFLTGNITVCGALQRSSYVHN